MRPEQAREPARPEPFPLVGAPAALSAWESEGRLSGRVPARAVRAVVAGTGTVQARVEVPPPVPVRVEAHPPVPRTPRVAAESRRRPVPAVVAVAERGLPVPGPVVEPTAAAGPRAPRAQARVPVPAPHRWTAARRSGATGSAGPLQRGSRRGRAAGPIERHYGPQCQGPSGSGGTVTSATRCWPDAEMSPITSMIRP